MTAALLNVSEEVAAALRVGRPVVALESTLIAHGLPWPVNHETALALEAAVREEGAVPATIAVWEGRLGVGLNADQLRRLATGKDVLKASRRDLAAAVAQQRTAATTVAATMYLAHRAGIRLFATGGIGGVHPSSGHSWDVSADLLELARTPVAVVCAGAKSILDLRQTLEMLETLGVPVVGYGTDGFPAFYLRSSGETVPARVDTPQQAAALLAAHWSLEGAGVVLAQPVAAEVALAQEEWAAALGEAEAAAGRAGVRGKDVTPFLLARLAESTGGRTLRANQALVIANARLAARVADQLASPEC
jgi:pseudouridine-5'-phosphate glycosidase